LEASPGKKKKKKKKVCETPSQWKKAKLGVVVSICHHSYGGKCKIGGSRSRPAWAKKHNPISKITRATGAMVQAVECLRHKKHKALSSNSGDENMCDSFR
jgi:hypothetical protein